MRLRTLMFLLIALGAIAAPALAATTLLADDAEGEITAKWVVDPPTNPKIQPWQKSDSTTVKHRGNLAHGGATSYWAGVTPADNHPVDVIEGSSTLTTKEPIVIPADGKTTISLWSFFQNEGDDQGLVEVAVDSGGKLTWKKLTEYKLKPSSAGDTGVVGYCNPADPQGTASQVWEEVKGDFTAYAGRKVFVRLNMKYGGENRTATQACGWYVDDIKIETTGTPGKLGEEAAPPSAPAPAAPAPAKSSVKLGALRARGKSAMLRMKVTNGPVRNAVVTLLKGRRKVAATKVAVLDSGVARVKLRLKRKLRRGTYVLKFKGTGADGARVTASSRSKVR